MSVLMSRMDLERDVRTEREKTVRAMMHTPSEAPCVVEDDTERRGDRSIGDDTDHEERDHRRILCPALAAPSYSQHQCPRTTLSWSFSSSHRWNLRGEP